MLYWVQPPARRLGSDALPSPLEVRKSFVQRAKEQCQSAEANDPGFAGKGYVATGDIIPNDELGRITRVH